MAHISPHVIPLSLAMKENEGNSSTSRYFLRREIHLSIVDGETVMCSFPS